jgi:hypothetical protein
MSTIVLFRRIQALKNAQRRQLPPLTFLAPSSGVKTSSAFPSSILLPNLILHLHFPSSFRPYHLLASNTLFNTSIRSSGVAQRSWKSFSMTVTSSSVLISFPS